MRFYVWFIEYQQANTCVLFSLQESFSCLIVSILLILCLPLSATSHFPSQNATGTEVYFIDPVSIVLVSGKKRKNFRNL